MFVPTAMEKLKAATVLRNLVAHHSRLWMRPCADSPKIPKAFPAALRHKIHPKSQYGVFMAVAEMLGLSGAAEGKQFLGEVDAILNADDAFKHGIMKVATKPKSTQ